MVFPNGWSVSVQYGKHNYHRKEGDRVVAAEVAVFCDEFWFDTEHLCYVRPCETVEGYCTAERVAEILGLAPKLNDFRGA